MSPLLRQPEIPAERPWWLAGVPGFEPGNGRIKSPNSAYSNNGHSEKTRDSGLLPIHGLGSSSEWCALLARTAWCMLLHRRFRRSHIVGLFEMPRLQRSLGAGPLGCLGFPSAKRWKPCSFRSSLLLWPGMSDRRAECEGSLLRCWLPPGMGSSVRQVLLRHRPMARLLQN